ncbi:MAG: SDR family oxidoreductase [Acidobacteria bacterium]|nr:SDR family oxidoreductase [Acidobacteriota bacterium]
MSGPSLDGQVALVTGGARGIGRAISERLAGLGAAVAIVDLDEPGARAAAEGLPRAVGLGADVGDYASTADAVDRAVRALGRIDVLVCNAGWDKMQPFLENEPALWDRLIAVNLLGVLNFCHRAVPHMVEGRSGRVVTVASDAGRAGSSGEAVYSACKGGVIAFTKALAREVARFGITANCVCPGPTDTPLLAEIRSEETGEKVIDAIVRATPLRRLARAEEIAEAVAFFAAGPAHVTGQVLSVSGGLTMAG